MLNEEILAFIEKHRQEAYELLLTLARIPAPSNHEEKRAKRCSGSTDCNIPLSLGIPSVCVGSYRGGGAHTREEYVEIDSLAQGYKVAFGMILGNV